MATVFAALREEGVSKTAVADQLQIEVDEVDKLVFGLMIMSLSGGVESAGGPRRSGDFLRIVK